MTHKRLIWQRQLSWQFLSSWIEQRAWALLGAMTLLFMLIFTLAALYKLSSLWMGFDLGTHEQVLWNTIHGRLAEVSPFGTTRSYLGVDIIIVELLLAPIYALAPHTETLLVLQVVLAGSGSLPMFLIARRRSGSNTIGLLGALLYLAALPVQYAILYEFQIRTVGTVLFLWAFLFFEHERLWPFLAAGLLAIWTRSDGSFALAAMGLYALLRRRSWPWVILPALLGFGWLALCLKVLIPAFRQDHGFLYHFLYAWLGASPAEMLRTLLLRPGYVAQHVLTPEKLRYLVELFAPLLFLPLLRPGILLIALPSLLLNLFSPDRIHWSIRYHYQAFVIPFLLIATIYALADLRERRPALGQRVGLLLLLASLAAQLLLRSPLQNLITRPRDGARIAVARQLMQQLPADAPITVTNSLGAQLARRRELYFFPGNVIYPPALVERGRYLLADLHDLRGVPGSIEQLRELQRSGRWRSLVEQHDFVLLERVTP